MKRNYTLINPERVHDHVWSIHKVGCADIAKALKEHGGTKERIKVDLDDEDEIMWVCDPDDLGYTIHDVKVFPCTGHSRASRPAAKPKAAQKPVTEPKVATTAPALANQRAALERLQKAVDEVVDKLVAERGVDDVGLNGDPAWDDERLKSCKDDAIYDLAVEVRKLRSTGEAWWRVAHELHLPGAGASSKQGRTGAAFARKLWRAAWGRTYVGETAKRESKIDREVRAKEDKGRPYFTGSELDVDIAETVRGKMIHWVARLRTPGGMVYSAQEAYVHDDPRLIKVKEGPEGRYVEFFEQMDAAMLAVNPRKAITKAGPLRAVYLDRITRVGV